MITQKFKTAVKDKNVIFIRATIKNHLRDDRKREIFNAKKLITYAENHNVDLYAPDDEETCFLEYNENWTSDFWENLFIELDDNFSREKINNVFLVMSHLRDVGHPDFQVDKSPSTQSLKDEEEKGDASSPNRWWIVGGIAVLACAFLAYKAFTK